MSTNIVIIGDLNIHVDKPLLSVCSRFPECLGLQQHIEVPTHTKGHTLDLIITDSASNSNIQVYDLGVCPTIKWSQWPRLLRCLLLDLRVKCLSGTGVFLISMPLSSHMRSISPALLPGSHMS